MDLIRKYLNKLKPFLAVILRAGLAISILLHGMQKVFPGKAGVNGLVKYVTHQEWGWLSTKAIAFINTYLTKDIGQFLTVFGWLQIILALMLLAANML